MTFLFKILYENKDFLVIDKPSGVVINKAQSVKGKTVQEWVEEKFKVQSLRLRGSDSRSSKFKVTSQNAKTEDFYRRNGIVHRLDKETSGLLIIAKNPQSFANLQKQFKERVVEKRYLALVHGQVKPAEGKIKAPVGRLPWNRERFGVFPGGREAATKYEVLETFEVEPRRGSTSEFLSLLEAAPLTGRTHQIRVHLKYLGYPIVGDSFYAGRKTFLKDRKWSPRLFLHASFLKFRQPTTGRWISLKSKLPKELEEVLAKLRFIPSKDHP